MKNYILDSGNNFIAALHQNESLKTLDGLPLGVSSGEIALKIVSVGSGIITNKPTVTVISSTAPAGLTIKTIPSNSNRLGVSVYNSANVGMFLQYGSGVSSSNFAVKVESSDYFEMPTNGFIFKGDISLVWQSTSAYNGGAQICEFAI